MMSQAPASRPDVDVYADIQDVITHYPPLAHDRAWLHVEVKSSHVVVSGNIKAQPTYEYVLDHFPKVAGVESIDHSQLYYDDDIRFQVARLTTPGVFVNVESGLLKLMGSLPKEITVEELVKRVYTVPGIRKVVTVLK